MQKPPVRHPARARIQPLIPGELRDRLSAFCAATGKAEWTVVTEALKLRLDPIPEAQHVAQQLAQLDGSIRELLRYLKHASRGPSARPSFAPKGE